MQIPQSHLAQTAGPRVSSSNEAGAFVSLATFDPSDFELAVRPWELMARPTEAGQFRHSISMLRAKDFFLYREDFSLSMTTFGLAPAGMVGIGVPLTGFGDTEYWGKTLGNTTCPMVMSQPLHVMWRGAHDHFIVFVDLETLRACLIEEEFEILINLAATKRANIQNITKNKFIKYLMRVIHYCNIFPEKSSNKIFSDIVLENLVYFLGLIARENRDGEEKSAIVLKTRVLRRIYEFIIEPKPDHVAMSDLCRIAEASERTLQYAFREEIGISVRDFLMLRRLHAARRHLLHADPNITSVTEIATEHGFFELGRFAGKYRTHFGELPSETLRKF